MAASILDVAKRARVSNGTVSRAFNGYTDIREETRQRIFAAAKELGYTPNISARNLSSKSNMNIGVIMSGLAGSGKDVQGLQRLQGIMDYATKNDLEVSLYATDSEAQRRKSYTQFCAEHSISGAILSGITTEDAYFMELMDHGIPTVAIDMPIRGKDAGWLSVDNRAAAREAVSYLIGLGHRNILILGGKRNADVHLTRMEGTEAAFEALGLPLPEERKLLGGFLEDTAFQLVGDYFSRHAANAPTAIFCFSDLMALGALRALRERGLSVPGDVSLIGFDDQPFCEIVSPMLSSVSQDMREFGYEAAAMLHGMMTKRESGGHRLLPYKLRIRQSVAPPKR